MQNMRQNLIIVNYQTSVYVKEKIMSVKKRRTIVKRKNVKQWVIFEGQPIEVGFTSRKAARTAAKKLRPRGINYKYVGRCAYNYRYIILDTH